VPLALFGQSGTVPQTAAVPPVAHALRISAGDLLELGVFDSPELSGKLRVSELGEVTLPIAGAIRVSGMTAEEAGVAIENRLRSRDVLKDPHVSVFIGEYATQGVTVTGEVKFPGVYALLGSHGLLEMISAAGGITTIAGRAVTITHKFDLQHPEVVNLDIRPGSIVANVDIWPGDTIAVSRSGTAYVVGDVGKPGGFQIENNDRLTVLQVVALAGGVNHLSAPDKAHLIRKTPGGREDFRVPLRAMLRGEVSDTQLEDGDVLFVPSSAGKTWAFRGIEAAIALTTGLILAGRL
jgi:polysaccharide export outer membrane protein